MQKIKNVFVDPNTGSRRHLLKKHRTPSAPALPESSSNYAEPSVPITGELLQEQKEVLAPIEPQSLAGYDNGLSREYELSKEYSTSQPLYNNNLYSGLATENTLLAREPEATLLMKEPVVLEQIQKEVVIQERIHPVEKEEIQPIIYREREQLDVRQVTQMMHETQIQPTLFEQRELAAEYREAIIERGAPIAENVILPSTQIDAVQRTQVVHAPIVEEVIKKTVIEEIQPVLERDVFQPTLVQQTQPIYEKIVEAPVVYREIRTVSSASRETVGRLNIPSAFSGKSSLFEKKDFNSPSLLGRAENVSGLRGNFEYSNENTLAN